MDEIWRAEVGGVAEGEGWGIGGGAMGNEVGRRMMEGGARGTEGAGGVLAGVGEGIEGIVDGGTGGRMAC